MNLQITNLQRDVLQNKRLFIFGKVGQGKSTTGNTLSGKKPFTTADSNRGVTQNIETFFEPELRLTIIDSPGVLDSENDVLFHEAFLESVESHDFDKNFLNKLQNDNTHQIDVFCMVCKLDENGESMFLDEAEKFVKLFSKSAISSLMIMFLENKKKSLGDGEFKSIIEKSKGYKYLMKGKEDNLKFLREFKCKDECKGNNKCECHLIPYCKWSENPSYYETENLQKAINSVEKPFTLFQIGCTIQLIRNELEFVQNKNKQQFYAQPPSIKLIDYQSVSQYLFCIFLLVLIFMIYFCT